MAQQAGGLTLFYHPHSAPCRVIWTFLLENRIQCKLELVNLFQSEQLDSEYLRINPNHTVPLLIDNRFVLYESAAIIRYLAAKFNVNNKWFPSDPQQKAKINQYFSWSKTYIRSSVTKYLSETIYKPLKTKQPKNADLCLGAQEKLFISLKLLEKTIANKPFVCGEEVTIADFVILEELIGLKLLNFDYAPFPAIKRWTAAVQGSVSCWDQVHQFTEQIYIPTVIKSLP